MLLVIFIVLIVWKMSQALQCDLTHSICILFFLILVLGGRRMVRSGQPDLTDYGVRMAVGQLGDHVDFMKCCERNETGAAVTAASLLALFLCCSEPRASLKLEKILHFPLPLPSPHSLVDIFIG